MRLVDFLIELLEAQAQTLQRLAALFGEERLLDLLEQAGELPTDPVELLHGPAELLNSGQVEAPSRQSAGSTYAELEGAVRELGLPEVLEFHLWAYPHYRAFIESSLDLASRIAGDAPLALIDEAVAQSEAWVKRLPIPPAIWPQAKAAGQHPWLRFRTNVLKRSGRRPLGAIT
jgi:hypothetical protein